eukprot:GHVS01068269.1.p1 GENE.GHVS01068269.1~~GHVS01068269.1.p1  ORF type:complete len:699 (+),score=140.76 GHVS01068269.1:267-2363(+)
MVSPLSSYHDHPALLFVSSTPPLTAPPTKQTIPSSPALYSFILTVTAIWLQDPILCLIDSATVGSCGGPVQLAALGPATQLVGGFTYGLSFIVVATTNLLAHAYNKCKHNGQQQEEKEEQQIGYVETTTTDGNVCSSKQSSSSSSSCPSCSSSCSSSGSPTTSSSSCFFNHPVVPPTPPSTSPEFRRLMTNSIWIASVVGFCLCILLKQAGQVLLLYLTHNSSHGILPAAEAYVSVRAWGVPFEMVLMCSEVAVLVQKQTSVVLLATLFGSFLNLTGDASVPLLFDQSDTIRGVAWSSNLSQMTTALLLVLYLNLTTLPIKPNENNTTQRDIEQQNKKDDDADEKMEEEQSVVVCLTKCVNDRIVANENIPTDTQTLLSTSSNQQVISSRISWRSSFVSFLYFVFSLLPSSSHPFVASVVVHCRWFFSSWSPPALWELWPFLSFGCPCLAQYAGKITFYALMTYTATLFGHMALATHQVVINFYFAFCPASDAISLATQTFLPDLLSSSTTSLTSSSHHILSLPPSPPLSTIPSWFLLQCRLCSIAASLGIIAAVCAATVCAHTAPLFTSAAQVVSGIESLSVLLGCCLLLLPLLGVAEGVLLARRDLNSIGWIYCVVVSAAAVGMFVLKKMILGGEGWGGSGGGFGVAVVWKVMVAYQFVRTSALLARVFWSSKGFNVIWFLQYMRMSNRRNKNNCN